MKKIFALVLAVVFVLALFAACGNTPAPAPAPTSQTPDTPDTPDAPDAPDTPDVPEGPYAVDEFGIAKEPYDWPLPLTDDPDTVLSYWWTTYSPQYIPADKEYGDTELPKAIQERTGVTVEYMNIPYTSRQEGFSVLLAADDLPDMVCYATAYYPGTPAQMVEDGYFANIYDHKDWMPNYLYQSKWADPEDKATYEAVFYEEELVPIAWSMFEGPGVTDTGYCVRQDMLDKVGLKAEDLKTWDDFYSAIKTVKNEIDTVEFPLWLSSMIETGNYWQFNSFENISVITTIAIPPVYFRDGEMTIGCTSEGDKQFAEFMSKLFAEKLVNPDWQGYFFGMAFMPHTLNNETFWQSLGAGSIVDTNNQCTDPNCNWVPVQKPLVTEDQVIHAGTIRSRTATGNCCFASKNTDLELCMKWYDYRYSPAGWELFAYGPEGLVVEKGADGVRRNTEWALSNPDGIDLSGLLSLYTASRMVEGGLCAYDAQLLNDSGSIALDAIDFWTKIDEEHFDKTGCLPVGVRLSTDQSEEVGKYRADLITYVAETFASFVDGSAPLSEWDNYQKTLDQLGRNEVLAVYQEAYEDYLAR